MSVTTRNPGEKWTAARANTKIEAPVLLSELATEVTNAWEDALGNPAGNGYVLTSTTGGTRSWTNPASLGFANPMTTLGDVIYGGASGAATRLAGNATTTKKFLASTGDGALAAAPAWDTLASGDVTSALGFTPFANPMTTSQDLIVGGASGAAARLAVGSNSQVLTVVGGNVTWATPTDVGFANPMTTTGDVIIGGALGVATRLAATTDGYVLTLSSGSPAWVALPADVGFANPMTTAGDLIVGGASGAATRLAKGTDTQVLTMVLGSVAWAAAPGGSFNTASDYTLTGYWTFDPARSSTVGQQATTAVKLGTGSTVGVHAQIGFAYSGSETYEAAALGFTVTDNSGASVKGDLFFATRNVVTDTQPTKRLMIKADGTVQTQTGSILHTLAGMRAASAGVATAFGRDAESNIVIEAGSTTGRWHGIAWAYNPYVETYAYGYIGMSVNNSGGASIRGDMVLAVRYGTGTVGDIAPLDLLRLRDNGQIRLGHQQSATTFGSGADMQMFVRLKDDASAGQYAQIGFGIDAATNAAAAIAYVSTTGTSSGYGRGDLIFGTRNGTTDAVPSERMRITSGGDVGIGASPVASITTATRKLDLSSSGTTALAIHSTSSAQESSAATDGAGFYLDVAGHATATNNNVIFRTGRTNSSYAVTEGMRLTSGGQLLIGSSGAADTFMTIGLSINQGGSDDEILAFKSSDVAHGITTISETNTYAFFRKFDANSGGLEIYGLTEGARAIAFAATATTEDTTKATTSNAYIEMAAYIKSGTSVNAPSANTNIYAIKSFTSSRFIFDSDGDLHADATVNANAYDAYDDVALVRTLEIERAGAGLVRTEFDRYLRYNRRTLEAARIATFNDHEGGDRSIFVNYTGLTRLHSGAIWQLGTRLWSLEEKVEDELTLAQRRIVELEKKVAWLEHGLEARVN